MEEQSTKLEQICRRLRRDEELEILLAVIVDSIRPNDSLLGTEMREDRYLKGCLREGVELVREKILIYANENE